ncbi:ankyrin repeat domain-containing protein [Wolbachia endosymbiont of Cimex lectularius]|uniref:ankyrin repeat domain-containing protein n=1 Tax=Wolbachia endosymbiont of Cimex lectularius TaxID=246273 RepID=UPI00049A7C36|nr:ankyrin repeat domain-containing protein [Wolbachia endosymbiont of Cimex lectularius]BAP00254.1 ankyrin repeat-containing protein [Wolbachia endosymbiont of Cimex lectularius]
MNKTQQRELDEQLFHAVNQGNIKDAKRLIETGASIHPFFLYEATCEEHEKMIELLLKERANINVVNRKGLTPLDFAGRSQHANRIVMAKLIVNEIVRLEVLGFYITERNLMLANDFIDSSGEIRNNFLQHRSSCEKEVEKLEKENKPHIINVISKL